MNWRYAWNPNAICIHLIYIVGSYARRPKVLPPKGCVGRFRSFLASTALEILSISVSSTSPDPETTSDKIT